MLTLQSATRAETWAKNSRFLAEALPVTSPEEAKELWRWRKENYDNGGHIVYAFATGAQQNILGCSDDGEPSGTAGRPVLAVLKGSGITNCLITVARWFGGTKLGTGGLVHAYGEAAKAALAEAKCSELIPECRVSAALPYALFEVCKRKFAEFGAVIENEEFTSGIIVTLRLPETQRPGLQHTLKELGSGRIVMKTV